MLWGHTANHPPSLSFNIFQLNSNEVETLFLMQVKHFTSLFTLMFTWSTFVDIEFSHSIIPQNGENKTCWNVLKSDMAFRSTDVLHTFAQHMQGGEKKILYPIPELPLYGYIHSSPCIPPFIDHSSCPPHIFHTPLRMANPAAHSCPHSVWWSAVASGP